MHQNLPSNSNCKPKFYMVGFRPAFNIGSAITSRNSWPSKIDSVTNIINAQYHSEMPNWISLPKGVAENTTPPYLRSSSWIVMVLFSWISRPLYRVRQTTNISSECHKIVPWSPKGNHNFWWLVRVTLVIDWRSLPQNFGPMVGTYKGLLLVFEYRWNGNCTCRWWGHMNSTCHNQTCFTFCTEAWWGVKN